MRDPADITGDGIADDESWRDEIAETIRAPMTVVQPVSGTKPNGKANGKANGIPLYIAPPDLRPDILLTPDVHVTTEKMCIALEVDRELYTRAGSLVHVIRAREAKEKERAPFALGSPVIRAAPLSYLTDRVSIHAHCVRKKKKQDGEEEWVHVPPPVASVKAVMERGSWDMRELVGVSETPMLRPDGTILQEPGYDDATGYLYEPNATFDPVDESPSQDDAARAYLELCDVFCDFPYASPEHASIPIAALLTVLARPAIAGAVPAFIFDASTRGSGKTLQCDVVSTLAFGRTAARANYPEKDEELEKVLAAYAMDGAQFILLDNVTRKFGGGPLDACITCRDDVEFRVLGRTEKKRLPWRGVICASGNNIMLGEDTARRALVARLESPLANPEERTVFKHDELISWVKAERPRLLKCALTILRAFTSHGSPDAETGRWGSFEEWSRLIPPAIVFARGPNPMLARATQAEAMNDTTQNLVILLEGLSRLSPLAPISARAMVATLYPETHDGPRPPDGFDELREVIEAETNCKVGCKPDSRRLGKYMQRSRDRIVGGYKLMRREHTGSHTAEWTAKRVQ